MNRHSTIDWLDSRLSFIDCLKVPFDIVGLSNDPVLFPDSFLDLLTQYINHSLVGITFLIFYSLELCPLFLYDYFFDLLGDSVDLRYFWSFLQPQFLYILNRFPCLLILRLNLLLLLFLYHPIIIKSLVQEYVPLHILLRLLGSLVLNRGQGIEHRAALRRRLRLVMQEEHGLFEFVVSQHYFSLLNLLFLF